MNSGKEAGVRETGGSLERFTEGVENGGSRGSEDELGPDQDENDGVQYAEHEYPEESRGEFDEELIGERYPMDEDEDEDEDEEGDLEADEYLGYEGEFSALDLAATSQMPGTTRSGKSIYERGSFLGSIPSFVEGGSSEFEMSMKRNYRRSTALGFEGIARIDLSPLTQKIVGCVIGENVTTEYPWMYVKKEIIEDNIDLHDESSDFLPIKDAVTEFSGTKMLIGYAPSSSEKGQFYVCVTEEAQDAVLENIEALRAEQENRVRNAVYKTVRKWTSLGSEIEVDSEIDKKTRPLYEIEVETTSDLLNLEMNFTDRGVDDQRDGYVELVSEREHFETVTRNVVGRGDQVKPYFKDVEAQTDPSMPNNMWTQYEYKCPVIDPATFDEEKSTAFTDFVEKYKDEVCDYVTVNENWDVYYNDYVSLVRNKRDTHPPEVIKYLEHQSYSAGKLCMDRVINSLNWHPLWTGTVAAAYTHHSKVETLSGPGDRDEVRRACEGNNKVLIWSFTDCLTPKLVLDSPREVTAISFCPLDGNVVVGGCANGQVAIWDIAGKIEQVETVEVRTPAQVKYRVAMQSLMTWMNETMSSSTIRPAAMSSLQHGQVAPITEIVWLPPYNKLDKNGRIQSLPADTEVSELTWQFATSSEDGTVAIWDLKYKPSDVGDGTARTKVKRQVSRPEPLVQAISPYKQLDRVFKPDYKLSVKRDDVLVPLSTVNVYFTTFPTIQLTEEVSRMDITTRRYHEQVIQKPDYEMEPFMVVGTTEGDLMRITWDGYEFSTGMMVNDEPAVIAARNKIHDGPVTVVARSKYLSRILITIGGKVFALWRDDCMDPIIWRKSKIKYTACCWGSCRPTLFLLAQSDGTIEVWDLLCQSEKPTFTQSVSGRNITGLVTHSLYLNPRCIAFSDYNGTLRVFTAPDVLMHFDESDIRWLEQFVDREVDRIKEFKEWQTRWSATNLENVERKRKLAEIDAEKQRLAEDDKRKREMEEAAVHIRESRAKRNIRSNPEEFLAQARERWKAMELRRMQRVILDKKGLRKDELEKQRAPMMMLREEVHRKKRKIKKILQTQDKIFEDSIAFLFPDQYRERRPTVSLKPPAALREKSVPEEADELAQLLKDKEAQPPVTQFQTQEEKFIYEFLETQAEALEMIRRNPYKPTFVWRKVLTEGKYRRKVMDLQLTRRNGHRRDYMHMKSIKEAARGNAKAGIVWFTSEIKHYDTDDQEQEQEQDQDQDQDSIGLEDEFQASAEQI
ncbi:dynein axonemal intermediate chain 3 [Neodiprion pinetum]|uniref:dynein axonemal intermediate chain 3 n=1 Tax=Neodiprion pinetum TaxID=441929 RepID=UPI001EDF04BD|nr:dynein axonemal intermediate chain 3-like [Neodiprion pinetum]